jgi:molybdate transport system substrate-binding protein
VIAVLLVAAAACGDGNASDGTAALVGSVDVFAASSLTSAFDELGRRFERAHPGSEVTFNFGASSTLAAQVRGGAPADVVATADEASMEPLVDAGLVQRPSVFARNRLAILVASGNPKGIASHAELAKPDISLVVCAPEVPCGKLAARALAHAGVNVRPVSYEANVKAVVSRVVLGEADAGIVYVTDVIAAGDKADGVEIPNASNLSTNYLIGRVRETNSPALAGAFIQFVSGTDGRDVLEDAGFETS